MARVGVSNFSPPKLENPERCDMYWREILVKGGAAHRYHSLNDPSAIERIYNEERTKSISNVHFSKQLSSRRDRIANRGPFGDVLGLNGMFYRQSTKSICEKFAGAAGLSRQCCGGNAMSDYHKTLISTSEDHARAARKFRESRDREVPLSQRSDVLRTTKYCM